MTVTRNKPGIGHWLELIAVGIVAILWAALDGQNLAQEKTTVAFRTGDAKKGQQLYMRTGCYQCHGTVGQGGVSGARLAPRPIPVVSAIKYIRRPTGDMPPYTAKVISDAELVDIYAFLSTIAEPPPASAIPLLSR